MSNESGSKARGFLKQQLRTFESVLTLQVALLVFQLTDDCRKTTQKVRASARESQQAIRNVADMMRQLRTEEHFERQYEIALKKADKRGIDPPVLPRPVRRPACYDDGSAPAQLDVKTVYRQQYYAVLDTAVNCV